MKQFPAIQKNAAAGRESLQSRAFSFQFSRQFLADSESVFRQSNRRPKNVRQLHRSVSFQRQLEARHRPWHSYRAVTNRGSVLVEFAGLPDVHVTRSLAGRHLAVIKKSRLAIR